MNLNELIAIEREKGYNIANAEAKVCQQISELKEEKEMLIKQLVQMDKIKQENQQLKKILAAKRLE